ncbi:Ap4A phosphorylase II [Ectocarpus siliculosus]|uniref:Ap4A phosphorylase II n=1 Tax=Ectocarpus siliculosus TaxID=2880 RepID=D8LQY6_ECTSI|nr:Ap4A phosphorylase II [Ectocarpus siliculosus]|eukprot:CBN77659.1 Ap4A phosphorylase II [Ectocarpus siliculosus]
MSSHRDAAAAAPPAGSRDEEDAVPRAGVQWEEDEEEEEEEDGEAMSGVKQSARDIFDRVQGRRWPAMPSFSFGGILGGEAGITDAMNTASGDNGVEEGGPSGGGIVDAWWRSFARSPGGVRRFWMVIGGVLVAVLIAVALNGGGDGDVEGDRSPLSAGTPRHRISGAPGSGGSTSTSGSAEGPGSYAGPSPLRQRLQHVADTALADGITLPMHTTFEALEAKAAIATPPASAASDDPFDPRVLDPRMELPPSHSLVLNKFNTVRNHALIITTEFQSQQEALTEEDFGAWYRVVEELPGVGFYNSAVDAGASQRHKHMQVIPDDALWDYRPAANEAIPVDEPISRLVGSSRDFSRVWRLPTFRFQHAFTLLPSLQELGEEGSGDDDPSRRMAAHLKTRYVELLREVGFDTSSLLAQEPTRTPGDATASTVPVSTLPPYNAVLTPRWLMLVPRSRREWGGIDVNGMGFLGALLVRDKAFAGEGAGVASVREPGALAVLEGVTFGASG